MHGARVTEVHRALDAGGCAEDWARTQLIEVVREIEPRRRFIGARADRVRIESAPLPALLDAASAAAEQEDRRAAKMDRDGYARAERAFRDAADAAAAKAVSPGWHESDWLACLPPVVDLRAGTLPGGCNESVIALGDGSTARCVGFRDRPGAYVLPGRVDSAGQEAWVRCALRSYVEPVFRRNIDVDGKASADDLRPMVWRRSWCDVPSRRCGAAGCPACGEDGEATGKGGEDGSRGGGRGEEPARAGTGADGEEGAAGGIPPPGAGEPGGTAAATGEDWPVSEELRRITWGVVGEPYDWRHRSYRGLERDTDGVPHGDKPGDAPAVPSRVDGWARGAAAEVGMALRPETGIVNLYHAAPAVAAARGLEGRAAQRYRKASRGNTMGGHRDDAEAARSSPVVSLSVGCCAVFLLGGAGREEEPVPLLLRSGDVMVLGGESRLCVHGIACVVPHTSPAGLFRGGGGGARARATGAGGAAEGGGRDGCGEAVCPEEEAAFAAAVGRLRLNVNVRQVYA